MVIPREASPSGFPEAQVSAGPTGGDETPFFLLPAAVSKEFVFSQNRMYRASGRPVGLGPEQTGEL